MLFFNGKDSTRSESWSLNVNLFRIFILSGLLLCAIMIGTYMNVFANTNDAEHESAQEDIEQSIYLDTTQTVDVQHGDTLWKIARAHAPNNMDVRYYIEQIKQLNELRDHTIYADQLLYLP